jgi:5-methylcytosine-specific restriction endonuclease McrA
VAGQPLRFIHGHNGPRRKVPKAPPGLKTCPDCGETKPVSEYYADKRTRDGLAGHCKACKARRTRAAYAANPDPIKAYVKAWRQANPEKVREHQYRKREENPELYRKIARDGAARRRAADPETARAKARAQYAKNAERERARTRAFWAALPEEERQRRQREGNAKRDIEKVHANVRKQKALRRSRRAEGELVLKRVVWERDGGVCGICGEPADEERWHLDHVVPLALGGEHTYANVQVSHPRCNCSKQAKLTLRRIP